jgi:class 3 adenylate cyclase
VHQYEGFVAQPLGDGIFALFGAPLAHEDHPQRALTPHPNPLLSEERENPLSPTGREPE